MDSCFELNDTQQMLRDSLLRYLQANWPLERRLATLAAGPGRAPLWHGFAHELGLLGAGVDEAHGGLGRGADGGAADRQVIMEALGSALAGEPYLGTAVIAGGVYARLADAGDAGAAQALTRLAAGETVVAFAAAEPGSRHAPEDVRSTLRPAGAGLVLDGAKSVVAGAPWADALLVTARDTDGALALLQLPAAAPGLRSQPLRSLDGGWAAELVFEAVPVAPAQVLARGPQAQALLAAVVDEATLAVCAEAIGVLRRLMQDTLDYVRQRKQFGVPLASFQVLQHRLADMHLALEQAAALTAASLPALAAPAAERAAAVSSAKVCVAEACRVVGQGAVQLHGGMGMTEELAVGHYFRRATQITQQFGSPRWHLRRLAALGAVAAA